MSDFEAARRSMVDCQVRPSDVTRYSIIEAMLWAPRELFVPKASREIAYSDGEIPVAEGRALLAPRVFAKMLEAVAIGPDDLVLDLAAGTGYSTAVIARMAEAVVAIESEPALVTGVQSLLDRLEVMNAAITEGDIAAGDAQHGPYDVIFINGEAQELPDHLTDQLKDGGRLVSLVHVGGVSQCRLTVKSGGGLSDRYMFDASGPRLAAFERSPEFSF